ncbi:MAG: cation:proton antiporter [Candidatus Omnitrophica bacterium]|nr:cation:proton antiporter [Candidatus Omnitrophota bacterium]
MARWILGTVILAGIGVWIIFRPIPFLFHHNLPNVGFFGRTLFILIVACFMCLYRIAKGPTSADRIVSTDILGIMLVGLCSILTVTTHRSWYIDIGIAWALQSFISTLALAKFLEGKDFDE